MAALVWKSNLGAMVSRLDRVAMKAMVDAHVKAAEVVAKMIKAEVRDWTSRTSTRKSRALERSWVPVIRHAGPEGVFGGVFSKVPYAGIHDRGGIIRAKGRALTIPVSTEARGKKSAREFGNRLFVVKWPGHLPVLAEKRGKKGDKLKVHYILKSAVRIEAKHYLARAKERAEPLVRDIIRDAAFKVMNAR